MWQRFTERARKVIFFAQAEARERGESYVSTEDILLGLTQDDDHVAARMLAALNVSLASIREGVAQMVVSHPPTAKSTDMQLTPRAKRVIDLAYDEARQLGHNYIGTEHLLLGLIREGEGVAGRVLADRGVKLAQAQEAFRALVPAPPLMPETSTAGSQETGRRPNPGDLGMLVALGEHPETPVAVDEEAYLELARVVTIKDVYGYRELAAAGRILIAYTGKGSEVKLLKRAATGGYQIRFLEGAFVGKIGWVMPEQFVRLGPDTRPFPPLISEENA